MCVNAREVETLFHECGHALQHMLTQQPEGLVAGIRGVEWDAVELPSQFMVSFTILETASCYLCATCGILQFINWSTCLLPSRFPASEARSLR